MIFRRKKHHLKTLATRYLKNRGHHVIHESQFRSDFPEEFWKLWKRIREYTLTSPERGLGLYMALNYLEANSLAGDVVECGVYKGGSSMLAALSLLQNRDIHETHSSGVEFRHLWLYDTFQGMPVPGKQDRVAYTNEPVSRRWKSGWWEASEQEVRKRMDQTGYPVDKIHVIAGDVRETLVQHKPESIALLRLDTDWYASTKAELEHLYPLLVPGGVLIVDDYGHFTGARQAVDEYFAQLGYAPLLNRLDYTGRIMVKPGPGQ